MVCAAGRWKGEGKEGNPYLPPAGKRGSTAFNVPSLGQLVGGPCRCRWAPAPTLAADMPRACIHQAYCHWVPGLSPLPFGVSLLSCQPLPAEIPLCPHCREGQSFFRKSQFMRNLPVCSLLPFPPTWNKKTFIKLHGLKRKKFILTHE